MLTHRLHSNSFLGLPYRIPNMNHKKELLWSLWVLWSLIIIMFQDLTGASQVPRQFENERGSMAPYSKVETRGP